MWVLHRRLFVVIRVITGWQSAFINHHRVLDRLPSSHRPSPVTIAVEPHISTHQIDCRWKWQLRHSVPSVGEPLNLSTFDGFIFSQGNSHEMRDEKSRARVCHELYVCYIEGTATDNWQTLNAPTGLARIGFMDYLVIRTTFLLRRDTHRQADGLDCLQQTLPNQIALRE